MSVTAVLYLSLLLFYGTSPANSEITINGDLMLGFVAPIREESREKPAGKVTKDGLNLAEVAMFVTEMANQEIMFETGVKLGLEILDSHQRISKISTRLFMPFAPHTQCSALGRTLAPKTDNRVVGVVGLDSHREIDDFSLFAEHYEIPVISYGASDPGLNEKVKYPSLLRSIPSDKHLYETMADQIIHTQFRGVGAIVEDTPYGRKSKEIFEKRLEKIAKKTIERTEFVPCPPRKEEIFRAIKAMNDDQKVNLVAFLVTENMAQTVIQALNELAATKVPRIIAPHAFSEYLNVSNAVRFRDMIVVRHVTRRLPNFGDYYLLLCQHGGKTPWWPDYWHGVSKETCLNSVPENANFNFIANAIYAFAHSLKKFMKDNCVGIDKHACIQYLQECRGRLALREMLGKSDFQPLGSTSQEPRFSFDELRDALPHYEVVQLKVRSALDIGLLRWGEVSR